MTLPYVEEKDPVSREAEIREQLGRRLSQLLARAEKIESDLRKPTDPDAEEAAIEVENDEVLQRLDEVERTEIRQIRAALARLDEGAYGICERCGSKIQEERLAVLPYTTLCITCAKLVA